MLLHGLRHGDDGAGRAAPEQEVAEADLAQQVDAVAGIPDVRAHGVRECAIGVMREPQLVAALRVNSRPLGVVERERRSVPVLVDLLVGGEVAEQVLEPVRIGNVPARIEDVHLAVEERVVTVAVLQHVVTVAGLRRRDALRALVVEEAEHLVGLRHVLDGVCVLVLLRVVVAVVELERIARSPHQRRADGLVLHLARFPAERQVVEVAVALPVCARDLECELLAHRDVDVAVELLVVIVAVAEAHAAAELRLRTLPGDVDDAGDRVAAEQRALRAAQDLDALQIDGLEHRAGIRADEHAVDDDADRGIEVLLDVGGADAADRDRRRTARSLLQVVDDDVGRRVGEVLQIDIEAPVELGLAHRADRGAEVLQVLLALARSHHDFLKSARFHLDLDVLRLCDFRAQRRAECGRDGDCELRIQPCLVHSPSRQS